MNRKPQRLSLVCVLLTAMAMGGAGGGCGPLEPGETESVSLAEWVLDKTRFYGRQDGALEGFNTEVALNTPVTYINAYASSDYIYGIELKWGVVSKLYGHFNGLDPQSLDSTDDPVYKIKVCVGEDGVLRGVRFVTVSGYRILDAGQWCGSASQTAMDDIDNVLTNMKTSRSTMLIGIKFAYVTPQ